MTRSRRLIRAVLPVMLLPILLSACVTTPPASPVAGCRADGADPVANLSCRSSLGDAQLFALNERALATTSAQARSRTPAQAGLPLEITENYIALRAQQAASVLLAARQELDGQRVASAPMQASQARARAEIAALRERLSVLTGLAPEQIDGLPGGPIPLPPRVAEAMTASDEWTRYAATRVAAGQAQLQAEQARAIAARLDMRVRAGKSSRVEALAADYQALDALQAEEQARAAMAQAWVAIAKSPGRGRHAPGR